jgi:hypothetical protein
MVQAQSGQFTYTINNGTVTITGMGNIIGLLPPLDIPNTIAGLPVTGIGDRAFWNISLSQPELGNLIRLISITIPASVTNIAAEAFYQCGGLTHVTFRGNAPNVAQSLFAGDNLVTVYYLPGTTGWGTTFAGRPTVLLDLKLQVEYVTNNGAITVTKYNGPGGAVNIPDAIDGLPVTGIGDLAFSGWGGLTSVTLGNNITNVGSEAFSGCTKCHDRRRPHQHRG